MSENTLNSQQLNRLENLVSNMMMSRQELFKKLLDPRRDINADCGFPDGWLQPDLFYNLYDRDSYAARVVEVFPQESWKVHPTVFESQTTGVLTPFEKGWGELGASVRVEKSYYKQETDSGIWEYLARADTLSRIGQYGVILLGIDDCDGDLTQPVNVERENILKYIRVFPEYLAKVTAICGDKSDQRFGQPERYMLTFTDPNDMGIAAAGVAHTTMQVHHSRVVHIAGNLRASEWLGIQAMRPVLNNLLSLRKVTYGSGEMFWRGAFPGLSIESHPQLGGDVSFAKDAMRDMMESYMNSLQRYIGLTGFTAKSLAPQISDPSPFIQAQIEAICIKLGIPIRIFKGSERGELASTQDDDNWNDRMKFRQHNFITPRIICPFIDRLINLRIIPPPENGYVVKWPDLTSMSSQDKANIALIRTQAFSTYLQSDMISVIDPLEYLTRWLPFSVAEAKEMIATSRRAAAEETDLSTPMGITTPGTPDEIAPDEVGIEDEQSPAIDQGGSSDLRATVGGSVAVADLQRAFYAGELPREAAMGNAIIVFGFTDEEAERLFPDIPAIAPQETTAEE